jgi:hypothetical protein
MLNSLFKFLDSFTLADREIFFGRDQEITERRAWGMEHGATGNWLWASSDFGLRSSVFGLVT